MHCMAYKSHSVLFYHHTHHISKDFVVRFFALEKKRCCRTPSRPPSPARWRAPLTPCPRTESATRTKFIGIARLALRWIRPGLAHRARLRFAAAFGGGEKLLAPAIIGGQCDTLRRVHRNRRNDAAGSRRHCDANSSTRKWASGVIFLLRYSARRRV